MHPHPPITDDKKTITEVSLSEDGLTGCKTSARSIAMLR